MSAQRLTDFLQDQIENAPFRVKAYVYNEKNEYRHGRAVLGLLKNHLKTFQQGSRARRWITMYGLRGTGKTTLLAQMYASTKAEPLRKLFLSVDEVSGVFGASLAEALSAYENLLGMPFERLEDPVYLFLDEVQFDPNWGLVLKTIFDRSSNVFIITTGSSAVALQASPDVARRSLFQQIAPMCFVEYAAINLGKKLPDGLSGAVRSALFESETALEGFTRMNALGSEIEKFWSGIEQNELDRFMDYGTLPYMIALANEALVYDQIKKTLDRVVNYDVQRLGRFAPETLSKIQAVLYATAESDQLVQSKLAEALGIGRPLLGAMLDTLEQAEVIWRVYPHGPHESQVRKASKYLFTSPAFRAMYFHLIGNTTTRDHYKGKLLEDTIGLYLRRIFDKPDSSVTYDSAAGGADFIVRTGKRHIIMEASWGDKTFRQVSKTMKKPGISAKYGLVISRDPIDINAEKTILRTPVSHMLLA